MEAAAAASQRPGQGERAGEGYIPPGVWGGEKESQNHGNIQMREKRKLKQRNSTQLLSLKVQCISHSPLPGAGLQGGAACLASREGLISHSPPSQGSRQGVSGAGEPGPKDATAEFSQSCPLFIRRTTPLGNSPGLSSASHPFLKCVYTGVHSLWLLCAQDTPMLQGSLPCAVQV